MVYTNRILRHRLNVNKVAATAEFRRPVLGFCANIYDQRSAAGIVTHTDIVIGTMTGTGARWPVIGASLPHAAPSGPVVITQRHVLLAKLLAVRLTKYAGRQTGAMLEEVAEIGRVAETQTVGYLLNGAG